MTAPQSLGQNYDNTSAMSGIDQGCGVGGKMSDFNSDS